jgi:hypothetical protein
MVFYFDVEKTLYENIMTLLLQWLENNLIDMSFMMQYGIHKRIVCKIHFIIDKSESDSISYITYFACYHAISLALGFRTEKEHYNLQRRRS